MSQQFTINGLWDWESQTVNVYLAGLNCGKFTVSSGAVTVPAQNDPDSMLTANYLVTVSDDAPSGGWPAPVVSLTVYPTSGTPTAVTVPCSVGILFQAEAQLLRPNAEQRAKAQQGPTLGETRRIDKAAFLVATGTAGQMSVGTSSSGTQFPAQFTQYTDGPVLDQETTFTGVYRMDIEDPYSYDGQLYWTIRAPQPLVISAAEAFLTTSER